MRDHFPGCRGCLPFFAQADPGALEQRDGRWVCREMGSFSLPGPSGILLISQIPGVKQWCLANKTGMEGNESQYYFRIFFIIFLLAFVEGSSILYVLL